MFFGDIKQIYTKLDLTEPLTVSGEKEKKMYIIFRNIIGELPFKGVKGLVELYNKLKEGVRLERPAHCSEEL